MPTSPNSIEDLVARIASVIPPGSGGNLAGFATDTFYYLSARSEVESVVVEKTADPSRLIVGVIRARGGHEGLRAAARAVRQVFQADLAYDEFSACSMQITGEAATLRFVTSGRGSYFVTGQLVVVPS